MNKRGRGSEPENKESKEIGGENKGKWRRKQRNVRKELRRKQEIKRESQRT